MAAPASLGGIALGSAGEAVAFGLGFALARVLEPEAVGLVQTAWSAGGSQIKALSHGEAAQIVAEDVEKQPWGEKEAAYTGIDQARFDALVQEILNAPGMGELLRMLRRGTITPDQFYHGLRKAKLETLWDTPLAELEHERLDPAVVATSIQRGIISDPGYLPTAIDYSGSDVPAPEHSAIDAVAEAAAAGISSDRLAVQTRIVGLPPAPGELLQLVNRGIINEHAFNLGVAEGNTRNEWAPYLLQLRRRLITPGEYAELRLRGWIDTAAMHDGAALSGMTPADTDLLFELHGRPIPVHQVTTGEARGGTFGASYADIPEAYLRSLEEGNLRPEWYDLAYANRYSYPSAFVIRALATSGELTGAETKQTLLDIGWPPHLADLVVTAWTGGTTAKADKHVTKAENELWTALHKAYVVQEADASVAQETLTALVVPAGAQTQVLALWDRERALTRRELTPSEIKKAYKDAIFTRDVAITRLEQLGYDVADSGTFLDE